MNSYPADREEDEDEQGKRKSSCTSDGKKAGTDRQAKKKPGDILKIKCSEYVSEWVNTSE